MGTPPCRTCYLTYDHLGTARLITDSNANVIARHDFLPFGEEIPGGIAGRSSKQFGPGLDNINQKFTGQERDSESSLDFFLARYFGGALGRFLSPDPGNAGASLTSSQSWNAYAYVQNNPLNSTDPAGLVACMGRSGPQAHINGGLGPCGSDYGGGGGGGGVSIDGGEPIDPGLFGGGGVAGGPGYGGGESGVQCPDNQCTVLTWIDAPATINHGTMVLQQQFSAFANGGSGYYSIYGPGGLYMSPEQAGIGAVQYINPSSIAQNTEYSGDVYQDANGVFSYTNPTPGTATTSPFDPTAIPDGTDFAGSYHTHGAYMSGYDSEYFSVAPAGQTSDINNYMSQSNGGQPAFLGTPDGRVEAFYPNQAGSLPFGCVLVGPPIPGRFTGVPTCH